MSFIQDSSFKEGFSETSQVMGRATECKDGKKLR